MVGLTGDPVSVAFVFNDYFSLAGVTATRLR